MPIDQIRTILWAQLKCIANSAAGGSSNTVRWASWLARAVWYGAVALLAWVAATALPEISTRTLLVRVISYSLLALTGIWQVVPVVLAATGLSLDLRRLLVYPVPPARLFGIEVMLRVSTGGEALLLLAGIGVGLARSPLSNALAATVLLPFVAFNLLLSAGIRDLLGRLLARRGVRELVVLAIVTLSLLPQTLMVLFPPQRWGRYYALYADRVPTLPLPWQVTAELGAGAFSLTALGALTVWVALAAWFGYAQFQRSLSWDESEVRAKERATASTRLRRWLEILYRLPSWLLPDPLGALVEKDVRSLARSPRFRLLFFMGCSIGLLVWVPLLLGRRAGHPGRAEHVLVLASLYTTLLLGEVLFWNQFGYDRSAAQAYFVMPVSFRAVLLAKNLTAVFFLALELAALVLVIETLRLPLSPARIPEAFAVTGLVTLFMLAVGNLASVHAPRAVDASQGWLRGSTAKTQVLMIMAYPVVGLPIGLAYLARYAFESGVAFYLVLASGFVVGAMTYAVALDSAVAAASRRREEMLGALARLDGPIS